MTPPNRHACSFIFKVLTLEFQRRSQTGGPPGLTDIPVTLHAEHTRCLSVGGGGVGGGGLSLLLQAWTELPAKV